MLMIGGGFEWMTLGGAGAGAGVESCFSCFGAGEASER